jgi:6-pyruvoyl-tetrahydropterin synthase
MKSDYKNLNAILQHYVDNMDDIGIPPEEAAEKAKVEIDNPTAFLMCKMMFDEGYLYRPSEKLTRYLANYKAKLFLDEGGYVTQKRKSDRKKAASWMAETFDFLKYPLGIIISLFALYKLLQELHIL